jgi:hypothetical protein
MVAARQTDYWDIVVRSLRITWDHKFLWFFGFFAASGGGSVLNWSERGPDQIRDFFLAHVELLALIIFGLVLLWLIFFVMSVISKGALVKSIARADRGEAIGFELAWRSGLKSFWGLLGILITGFVTFIVVTAVCVIAVVVPLAAGAAGVAIAVLIGAVLLVPYLAFLFALTFVIIYAEREYVVGGATFGDAMAAGWTLTRENPGKSLLMWLVSFLSGLAFFVGLAIVLLALALPFILIGLSNLVLALALGIPLGVVVLVLASSAFSTYDHALWTLFYLDIRGTEEAPPVLLAETPDPEVPGVG